MVVVVVVTAVRVLEADSCPPKKKAEGHNLEHCAL